MGCLSGNASKVGSVLVGVAAAVQSLSAEAFIANERLIADAMRATMELQGTAYCPNPKITASAGLICSINGEAIIRFEKDKLTWNNKEDNQIGVTKYNLLIASGDWILEEIEELL